MPNPRVRRKARERALQFLFGIDFTQYNWEECLDDFWVVNPTRPSVQKYALRLIRGVCGRLEELDERISTALDRWTPERVGRIERNIIRIAYYEMLFCDDVPEKVAINEAIEVAKNFGADEAPRFVNGVLDRLKGAESSEPSDS